MNAAVKFIVTILLAVAVFLVLSEAIDWAIKTTNNLPAVIYSVGFIVLIILLCGLFIHYWPEQKDNNPPPEGP